MAINNFLCSDPSCSNRELISCIEYFTSQQSSQLLLEIEREFGPLEVAEVMEKLRLCNEFFPAFHAMVTELQDFLGENSYHNGESLFSLVLVAASVCHITRICLKYLFVFILLQVLAGLVTLHRPFTTYDDNYDEEMVLKYSSFPNITYECS